jgi:tetratricopeptide (TPR) repeat protein
LEAVRQRWRRIIITVGVTLFSKRFLIFASPLRVCCPVLVNIMGGLPLLQPSGSSAVKLKEDALYDAVVLHGEMSPQVQHAATDLVFALNAEAMRQLSSGEVSAAKLTMDKAVQLTEPCQPFVGSARAHLTTLNLNNMACVLCACDHTRLAVKLLRRALAIKTDADITSDELSNHRASTYLNLCASLSAIGRHQHAAQHAAMAIQLLNKYAITSGAVSCDGSTEICAADQHSMNTCDVSWSSLMATGYYNLATELEHMRMLDSSAKAFAQAEQLAAAALPTEHTLHARIQRSKARVTAAIAVSQRQQQEREQSRPAPLRTVYIGKLALHSPAKQFKPIFASASYVAAATALYDKQLSDKQRVCNSVYMASPRPHTPAGRKRIYSSNRRNGVHRPVSRVLRSSVDTAASDSTANDAAATTEAAEVGIQLGEGETV